jgi:hypothetical protein
MMTPECAFDCAQQLSMLKFHPGADVIDVVAEQIMRFIPTDEQARKTVEYVLDRESEWPSIAGLRTAARNFGQLLDEDSHGRNLRPGAHG